MRGKARLRTLFACVKRDHPRVCGEKSWMNCIARRKLGSPPRMRGKVVAHGCVLLDVGITPAYAGKSKKCEKCRPGLWDHPRVCGEKSGQGFGRLVKRGSPPRMRGKASIGPPTSFCMGITPAYAGKSHSQSSSSIHTRDHPRVCGEKMNRREMTAKRPGSPPRMRGKGLHVQNAAQNVGITPAYAGKSTPDHAGCLDQWDHPRVCGEKSRFTLSVKITRGSPPRMRGKDSLNKTVPEDAGITPAYAGKSHRWG